MRQLTDLYKASELAEMYDDYEILEKHNEFISNYIDNFINKNGNLIMKMKNHIEIIYHSWDIDYDFLAIKDGIDLFITDNNTLIIQAYYNGFKNETNRIYLYIEKKKYY